MLLRTPREDDYRWVVDRHRELYLTTYGWGEDFAQLVKAVVDDFVAHHDPSCEAAWIAEVRGQRAGSVFCVRKDETTAQLRLLLVEPSARGQGIGRALVDECVRFAREHGYRCMVLWTNDVLHSARRIYEAAGFSLVHEGAHPTMGVEQTWELAL